MILSPLISILSFSSSFYIAHWSLGEGGAALRAEGGKEHSWRQSKVVGGRSKVIVSPSCNPYGMGDGSDYGSWEVSAGLSWNNLGDNIEGRQDWSGTAAVLSASAFGVEAGETLQRAVCSFLKFPSFIPSHHFFSQIRRRTKYSGICPL